MTKPRNNAPTTRGRPFQPGNPGRPKGARHKATLAVEALLDGEAEALTRKAIETALEGDTTALRLCLERLCPPRRDRPVLFALPPLETATDAPKALAAITAAVADGDLTPAEAGDLSGLVERFIRVVETADLAQQIEEIKAHVGLGPQT